jgi:chromosome segregation ATPase
MEVEAMQQEHSREVASLQQELEDQKSCHLAEMEALRIKLETEFTNLSADQHARSHDMEIEDSRRRIDELENSLSDKKNKSSYMKSLVSTMTKDIEFERKRCEELELSLSKVREKKRLLKQQLQFSDIENYSKIED